MASQEAVKSVFSVRTESRKSILIGIATMEPANHTATIGTTGEEARVSPCPRGHAAASLTVVEIMNANNGALLNTWAHLHDAELFAIRNDPGSSEVEFVFRKVDGCDSTLLLTGVQRFRCSDFGLQNVVLQLVVFDPKQQPTLDEIRQHVQWISTTSDGERVSTELEIETAAQDVLEGRVVLVRLIPSWGAQAGALAKSIGWK